MSADPLNVWLAATWLLGWCPGQVVVAAPGRAPTAAVSDAGAAAGCVHLLASIDGLTGSVERNG